MSTSIAPKISVIVITYNRPEFLKETIQSILNQTFTNFELIIVDNCSDYDFLALAHDFNDIRIKAFQNQNGGIIAVNRNFGILKASGEYIALCDDDDLWFPEKLEKQLYIMENCHEIGFCCTASLYINQTINRSFFRKFLSYLNFILISSNLIPGRYLLLLITYITNSSVMLRRSVLNVIGLLDEDPDFKAVEDYDLWLRISLKYRVFYLKDKLVNYRLHSHQISGADQHSLKRKKSKVLAKNFNQLNNFQRLIVRLSGAVVS
ncbi:Glycosyltransferase, GT2 family [Daejeonella rubra]|uniref:Glycosyltransferase, GT2 family n=1 Tax=Daejeonella rubra TaxID=990371 RepID=A0A1G9WWD9_9SPHI|nr:glycosyltransferase [Daejeonella rubra]SDM88760.1 Glycosyltransferase, GT2 family [Daejeonella rubra]